MVNVLDGTDERCEQEKVVEDLLTTGFEEHECDKWTTLEEGYTFINELVKKSDRITSSVVGISNKAHPLILVKAGFPAPPCDADIASGRNILIMGTPHGNEPAGREATFKLMRELAWSRAQCG